MHRATEVASTWQRDMTKPRSNEIQGDILIVDDDLANMRTLSTLLTDRGYEVRSARDGATALMMASADLPDLVLLDLVMPEMDGFQVCQRLKSNPETSDIPIIFVSALDEVVDKVRGFEVGGVDYITKPYNAEEVGIRVKTHLALYKLRRELEREISERERAEEALRASRHFIQSSLDALSAHIAILDGSGTILAVNASWRYFADQNGLGWEDYGVGRNYLEVAEAATGMSSQGALEAATGIREVIAGVREAFRLEYPCHGPEQKRWFVLRVTRFESSQGVQVVTSHEDISERVQAEKALRARTEELGERVKELNCLYGISALIERPGISLEEILQGTAELIPPAWQFPETTCARIVMEGQKFRSESFRETLWKQASPLSVHGERCGKVEVCYLEERPEAEEGPFLKAERKLLDAIAERIGRVAERFQAEKALRRRVDELSALNRVAQVVATAADVGETLETAVQTATELFDARTALIAAWDSEDAELQILAGFEPTSGAFATTSQAFSLNEMPITRRVLDSGQSTVVPDVRQVSLSDPVHRFVSDLDLRAFMLIPLKAHGTVIGVLAVGSDQPERTFASAEVALAETIAGDVASAIENARLAEQARAAAVDTERSRLARELHDSVTQALYSITLYTDATLLALSAGRTGVVKERLEQLNRRAREAMTEMRLLIYELRPSILEERGLAEALKARLESVEVRSGLKADLQVVGERRLPPEVEEALYRVALEGLNNVLKHARAGDVELGLLFDESTVRLTIRDDGTGFDVDSASRYGGYGLAMMKERVQHIDGALSIETAPGAGTTLHVEVKA